MPPPGRTRLIWLWTVAALGGFVWGVIAVVFASVGPSQYIPRVFYSHHIEHFAAFYVIFALAAAGLPTVRLYHIVCALLLMALILATVRLAIPRHRLFDVEDLGADVAGIAAGLAPIIVSIGLAIWAAGGSGRQCEDHIESCEVLDVMGRNVPDPPAARVLVTPRCDPQQMDGCGSVRRMGQ